MWNDKFQGTFNSFPLKDNYLRGIMVVKKIIVRKNMY